jgi:cell division protein FtsQ
VQSKQRGVHLNPGQHRPIRGEVLLDEATSRRLRRRRIRRAALSIGLLAIVPTLAMVYMSPAARVQNVEVVGASQIDPAEVRSLASLDGDSMLRLDTEGAAQRIRYLPSLKAVRIEQEWPQTVRIIVEERQPWANWQVGDKTYVIDSEGIVLADVSASEGAPTVIDLTNPVRLVPGDRVDSDAVQLTRLLTVRVPEVVATTPTAYEYSDEKGLALTADVGYRVVIGDSQNVEYKLAVWKKIEETLGRDSMSGHVLDLRFEGRPAFQ